MLTILNQTDMKSFNSVRKEYPYSRILMKINTLDDCEGQLLAVSDSAESDDDLCEKLHEFLDHDCRKLRSGRKPKCYVQCQMRVFILSTANCIYFAKGMQ